MFVIKCGSIVSCYDLLLTGYLREMNEYSLAVKPPFQNAGYRRSRNGVPLSCNFIRYHSA